MQTKDVVQFVLQLLQTLIWPAFGVFLVLALRKQIAALLQGSSLTSLELPGGIKIGLGARLASAAAAGVAIGKQTGSEDGVQSAAAAVQTIAEALSRTAKPGATTQRRNILWVDDNPGNNSHLVDAFRALGYSVFLASSTDEAVAAFFQDRFDLVISDMARPPDPEAGLTLLKTMRSQTALHVPLIIFAAGWAREHTGQEAKYGLAKITNDASVVYATVVDYMTGGSLPSV